MEATERQGVEADEKRRRATPALARAPSVRHETSIDRSIAYPSACILPSASAEPGVYDLKQPASPPPTRSAAIIVPLFFRLRKPPSSPARPGPLFVFLHETMLLVSVSSAQDLVSLHGRTNLTRPDTRLRRNPLPESLSSSTTMARVSRATPRTNIDDRATRGGVVL